MPPSSLEQAILTRGIDAICGLISNLHVTCCAML